MWQQYKKSESLSDICHYLLVVRVGTTLNNIYNVSYCKVILCPIYQNWCSWDCSTNRFLINWDTCWSLLEPHSSPLLMWKILSTFKWWYTICKCIYTIWQQQELYNISIYIKGFITKFKKNRSYQAPPPSLINLAQANQAIMQTKTICEKSTKQIVAPITCQ